MLLFHHFERVPTAVVQSYRTFSIYIFGQLPANDSNLLLMSEGTAGALQAHIEALHEQIQA